MEPARLQAWWSARQALDGSLQGKSAAEVLQRTGWSRSVGGAAPYLTLFARAGTRRKAADSALATQKIHELPSARGCTYVVPASDFALALKVGQGFGDEMKTARKLGVTDKEIDKLCDAVVRALAGGPLEPDGLRESAGGKVRSLGEPGKKRGLSTTLPVALGRLQLSGEIRRVPTNGRLDQQRYRYDLWKTNPLDACKLSTEEAYVELARRYFAWTGPASPAEFRWFSGLGVQVAKTAMEPLELVPFDADDERMIFPSELDELKSFKPSKKPQYSLIGSLDGLFHLRRDVQGLLDEKDRKQMVFADKALAALGGLSVLPSHAIVDRGRLVGLWEYDTESESMAWASFVTKDRALLQAVGETEEFVRSQLEDARSFSLDSPKRRSPRIKALRRSS